MSTTLDEQIKAMRREIGMRCVVYPRRVDAGKMTQKESDYQIRVFQDILAFLENIKELTADLKQPDLFD